MKNQKSRRINRKQPKRKTIKRKTIKRKTIKRKTTKRKTTKRKQNKKIVYNQKKMYGGDFNPEEKKILKESLERFDFTPKELEEVMKILGYGGHYFSGDNLIELTSQYEDFLNKHEFLAWLFDEDEGYVYLVEAHQTDNEDNDEDDDDDDDDDDENFDWVLDDDGFYFTVNNDNININNDTDEDDDV